MRTVNFIIVLVCAAYSSFAQVGIGNTDPKAVLDISATNSITPTNTDGILIPRVDNFPSVNPTADQDGMLIFITGNSTPEKGFYFWDTIATTWDTVTGAKEINDLIDGKSATNGTSLYLGIDAGASDAGTTDKYNVGIGLEALSNGTIPTTSTAIGAQALLNSIGTANTSIGYETLNSLTTGGFNTALGNAALFSNTTGFENTAIGYLSGANSSGSYNVFLGTRAGGFDTGNHKLYIENSSADANNALIYGEFDNDILRTNGEFQIGNPTISGYAFPTTDGANGQVMTSDGAGNINWVTPAASGTTASNGLTTVGSDIQLGGTLSQNTTLNLGDFNATLNLNSFGHFNIQDNGTTIFNIADNGDATFGEDTYWRGGSTSSSIIGHLYGLSNNGNLDLYTAGTIRTKLTASGNSYFSNGNLGIGTTIPNRRLDVEGTTNLHIADFTNTFNNSVADGIAIRMAAPSPDEYITFFRGTTSSAGRIEGTAVGVNYATVSDRRLKMNIEDINAPLKIIEAIKPQVYQYKAFQDIKEYGFIAQDLQKIYPQAVSGSPDSDPTKEPMMVD